MVTGPMLKKRLPGPVAAKGSQGGRLLHDGQVGHAGQHPRRGLGHRHGAEPGLAARGRLRRPLVQHVGRVRLHRRDPRLRACCGTASRAATTSAPWNRMRRRPSPRQATWIRDRSVSDAGTFDYVIAGGGTAGCVLAARLSEDPDVTVCLVEAGPSDVGDANILPLSEWMHLLDSGYDWDYPVEPQEKGNSFMRHARAKVLGGCSSHNSCIAFHPPAECLDEWVEMGATGWSAAEILPLVKRLENNDAPGDHGHDGPVRLQDVPPNDPCGVGGAGGGGAGRTADGGVQPRRDGAQRRGLVPDQRRRGRHPHVDLACVPAPDPRHQQEPRGAHRLLGVGDPVRRREQRRPGCGIRGPTSPATTRCRRVARSSSPPDRSIRRNC